MVAITGVSGSGKSSIAKDIIYAEGQRRYLDCLSPYARQFIKELRKPEIDEIKNIAPTICVYQHTFQPSRLSTIGTMSEVYNFLRLLYAKIGIQHCPDHPEEPISPLSPEDMALQIKSMNAKSIRLLAPVIKKKKGNHRAVLERAVQSEISQIRVDGVFLAPGSISMQGGLEKSKVHTIEFVVAKFAPKTIPLDLLQDAIRQALSLASGTLVIMADSEEFVLSTERTCPQCKRGFFKPDPEDLSFSSRRGACSKCSGTGVDAKGIQCKECSGSRLNPIGRNVRLSGKTISEASNLIPGTLRTFLEDMGLDERSRTIAQPIFTELFARTKALEEVGLDYLPLGRDCATLSGGELQRLRLATAMGSPLTGVIYIFDEPSAGLHPLDNIRVLARLQALKNRGNSVLMIEHDSESILSADYILDIGPGGGSAGGNVVFNGSMDDFLATSDSETAKVLRKGCVVPTSEFKAKEHLSIKNASCHNIHGLSLSIPLHGLITVAGVSGAGKSSLVRGVIAKILQGDPDGLTSWKDGPTTITSTIEINRVLEVDQKPIGSTNRSTPASYLGVWDHIRNLFAQTLEAKSRGWTNSFFSFNSGKGRCPECKGQGQIKLEMSFLPDAFIPCERCRGSRFTEDALSVRYLGLTIGDALNLTFTEAMATFVNHRKIYQPLRQACDLGVGYLTLGQTSSTLSGGESQRIKLVSELSASRQGHTLYILDEPTTGLHKSDVEKLLKTLKTLVSLGNTVMVIEHDSDVIAASDHVIEFGPGPGEQGGEILFSGAPSELVKGETPWGRILASAKNLRADIIGQSRTYISNTP